MMEFGILSFISLIYFSVCLLNIVVILFGVIVCVGIILIMDIEFG